MANVEKQLKAARERLLDLSGRNRLLNHHETKRRSMRLLKADIGNIYETLVVNNGSMGFHARRKAAVASEQNPREETLLLEEQQDEEGTEELLFDEAPTQGRPVDPGLYVNVESDALQKRLFRLDQEARSALDEQGYNIFYIAIGFLEWKTFGDTRTRESEEKLPGRAPLILVPVELERSKAGSPYRVRWTGGDIGTNTTLKIALADYGVFLADFEMPDDADGVLDYLKEVENTIGTERGWRVLQDAVLDFFSFNDSAIYFDLDPNAWPAGMSPADHPLLQMLLDPAPGEQQEAFYDEKRIDAVLSARNVHHVMDADPSQIAVIETAKQGANLVVEGPPGTGKSQTIVNLIAELLAAGKSVLFVSEKKDALQVVKSRMDKVGLSDVVLFFGDKNINNKVLLQEIQRTLKSVPSAPLDLESELFEWETLRSELNEYAHTLGLPVGSLGETPYTLFGRRETARRHFADVKRTLPRISFLEPERCMPEQWRTAQFQLKNVIDALPGVSPLSDNPWRSCRPNTILPADADDIRVLLATCSETLYALEAASDALIALCAIERPNTPADLPHALSAAAVISASKPVDRQVLLNAEWNSLSASAADLISKVKTFQEQQTLLAAKFQANALEQDIPALHAEYQLLAAKTFRLFFRRYRELRQTVRVLYTGSYPRLDTALVSDLKHLADNHRLCMELRSSQQAGQAFFGSHWQAENSDPIMLHSFAEWIVMFRKQMLDKVLSERAVDVVSEGVSQKQVQTALACVRDTAAKFISLRDALCQKVGADGKDVFGLPLDHVSFADFGARLAAWEAAVDSLPRWAQFVATCDTLSQTVAAPVLSAIDKETLTPEDILPCVEANFADDLLRVAFLERPALSRFDGSLHERKIKRFMELDSKLIVGNRYRLATMLHQGRPRVMGGASANSEAGILLGEFQRKRGHMPLRKLIMQIGGLIQKIKPCFMMSPSAIAQFLDPRSARFDVIIFDEASQVKPERALGAFLRGNQAVVMGDTRQLPPTSFFDMLLKDELTEDDEDDNTVSVTDVESILHQCRRSFPTRELTWHYRSKHESLIAVSNQEIYNNALRIYPSSTDKSESLGLHFIHLPEAVYERGRTSLNYKEVQAVSAAVIAHYRAHPDKSLMVGTFNTKQQNAIKEEVERLRIQNPDLEPCFRNDRPERFDVKNLETIQGDERDVVFISIGFGFDQNHKLSMNFGPLNQEGGWRRLNVLITRARERCVVFSNFHAYDMPVDNNSPRGLQALKVFLEYADTRRLQSIEPSGGSADSPFEVAVESFLHDNGHIVRRQVGCAGFRIDLAVVDPDKPGRYLLGIECDGAKYHSSPVARDRDRLRQQILEGMGWTIHRIWSTDWYRNRAETETRLLNAIEAAHQASLEDYASQKSSYFAEAEQQLSVQASQTVMTPIDEIDNGVSEGTPYVLCSDLGIQVYGEIDEYPVQLLALAVARIVEIESPVHVDEVIRRIRTQWGKQKAGRRIREAVIGAANLAIHQGQICQKEAFLWRVIPLPIVARLRTGDPPAKIEFICDEEIEAALRQVLQAQFATLHDDLALRASRLLGFRATSDITVERIHTVITDMLKSSNLVELPNGMLQSSATS